MIESRFRPEKSKEISYKPIRTYYNSDIWKFLMRSLEEANHEIFIATPWITLSEFVNRLIELQKNNPYLCIKILSIEDRTNNMHKKCIDMLDESRIHIRLISKPKIHLKMICIDRKLLVSGSFNLTSTSLFSNYETANFITDMEEIEKFLCNFNRWWKSALHQGATLSPE